MVKIRKRDEDSFVKPSGIYYLDGREIAYAGFYGITTSQLRRYLFNSGIAGKKLTPYKRNVRIIPEYDQWRKYKYQKYKGSPPS